MSVLEPGKGMGSASIMPLISGGGGYFGNSHVPHGILFTLLADVKVPVNSTPCLCSFEDDQMIPHSQY